MHGTGFGTAGTFHHAPPPAITMEASHHPPPAKMASLSDLEDRSSVADSQGLLRSAWLVAPNSWGIHQEKDHWRAYVLQTTPSATQDYFVCLGVEVDWTDNSVQGAIFFFPQLSDMPALHFTHPTVQTWQGHFHTWKSCTQFCFHSSPLTLAFIQNRN